MTLLRKKEKRKGNEWSGKIRRKKKTPTFDTAGIGAGSEKKERKKPNEQLLGIKGGDP